MKNARAMAAVMTTAFMAGLVGCATTPTENAAVFGGALGAGLGAIVGNQSGHQGEGALIGAAAGALSGAVIGDSVTRQQRAPQRQGAPQTGQSQQAQPTIVQRGHYETRIVSTPSGETYEERIWVPDPK